MEPSLHYVPHILVQDVSYRFGSMRDDSSKNSCEGFHDSSEEGASKSTEKCI